MFATRWWAPSLSHSSLLVSLCHYGFSAPCLCFPHPLLTSSEPVCFHHRSRFLPPSLPPSLSLSLSFTQTHSCWLTPICLLPSTLLFLQLFSSLLFLAVFVRLFKCFLECGCVRMDRTSFMFGSLCWCCPDLSCALFFFPLLPRCLSANAHVSPALGSSPDFSYIVPLCSYQSLLFFSHLFLQLT